MKSLIALALAAFLFPGLVSAQDRDYDNSAIPEFDLSKYLGTWYEIARFDHSFERGLDNVMAIYTLRDDGKVDVMNTGWKDGKFKVRKARPSSLIL